MSKETTTKPPEVVKRRPSECGDWETGCHYRESNDAALCALSDGDYYLRLQALLRRWRAEMKEASTADLIIDAADLELLSLGWLLANARDIYDDLCAEAAQFDDAEDSADNIRQRLDPSVIRDWFCWLHREMVHRAQEEKLHEN